jgi:very-short-patch-repair endonuclease
MSTPSVRARARRLRENSTDAERKLWRWLRARRLSGLKFRRQHPIGAFIVDFVCLERRLIIELDGGQHSTSASDDARRTRYLRKRGFESSASGTTM